MAYNPILKLDYPDLDVIRVEDTYYMISTTMYFMPGGAILRSYDLVHWEIAAYLYDILEDTPAARLADGRNIYGQGMWAASLRFHEGTFYACFVANDTGKTYLYRSERIEGPWRKSCIKGFYHDCSLLFDDGHVYIAYGNTDIWLTELDEELTGPKPGGLHRLLVSDNRSRVGLGYEGSHLYKINGKYYLFLIHWPNHGTRRRTEACFVSDSLTDTFIGRDIMDDDMGYFNAGVAQGGVVDTPDGHWYAMLFQDYGALGRIPVLVPVDFDDSFPVLGNGGKVPRKLKLTSTRPGYTYSPLYGGDDFVYRPGPDGKVRLKAFWQWNHIPNDALWSVTVKKDDAENEAEADRGHGYYTITSGQLASNVTQAVNTLTQRLAGPRSLVTVTLDGSGLNDGDFAGLVALQGCYALVGLTRENGQYYVVMLERNPEEEPLPRGTKPDYNAVETARAAVSSPVVALRLDACFENQRDEVCFFYAEADGTADKAVSAMDAAAPVFQPIGDAHRLYFRLDHFTGCRAGLFLYSTAVTGGKASFSDFRFEAARE
ncbi:MAG: glycoside hydrolase 43 family protein [Lachnospiraceae bacterium]|nr:glycoside hydrolase 43 family protein [Lachnospiraceae bacterium]